MAYRSYSHHKEKRKVLKRLVIPFVLGKDIEIDCFDNSPLWGLDKDTVGVNVIPS